MDAPFPSLHEVDSYFPDNPQPTSLPVPISEASKSFWLFSTPDCNPLSDHGKDAPLPSSSVDVVIVGTGISGIFALYHLVQALRSKSRSISRIVLLEARQFCSGATGRNGGQSVSFSLKSTEAESPLAVRPLHCLQPGRFQVAGQSGKR
jgi:hypothetical protein